MEGDWLWRNIHGNLEHGDIKTLGEFTTLLFVAGERPYMCKLCGQTFAQNGSYRMHERRHMMEMLHKCPICPVKFSQWEDAKAHLATHPEIAGVADFMKHLPSMSSAGETDEENMPPMDGFAPQIEQLHLDQFPPPGFPFPSQLSPFFNLSSLHFGAALGDLPTPAGLFAAQGQVCNFFLFRFLFISNFFELKNN